MCSFLLSVQVTSVFWREAVLIAAYVINMIPTSHNSGLYTFHKLYGDAPNYPDFHIFGYTCFFLLPHVERTKLSYKSVLCFFLVMVLVGKDIICIDPFDLVIVFLDHIPYFSFHSSSHNMKQTNFTCIDPFDLDIGKVWQINYDTSVLETSQTPTSPSPSMTTQSSSETLDPPPVHQSIRVRKSILGFEASKAAENNFKTVKF